MQARRRFYDHELSSLEGARPASNSGGSAAALVSRQSEPRPLASLGKRLVEQALAVNPGDVSKITTMRGVRRAHHGGGKCRS